MFQEPNYYSIASTEVYVVIKKKVKFTTTALNSLTVSFIVVSFIGTIHRCSGCISEETLSTVAGLQGRVVTPTDEGTTLARDSRHYTCYTTDFHSVSPFFLILINIFPTPNFLLQTLPLPSNLVQFVFRHAAPASVSV